MHMQVCALALLVCAMGASAAEVPVISSHPPKSDLDNGIWSDFTTAWNRSHETEYTPRELRASLPGITTADVAWVLAERAFNKEMLDATRWSPEYLLLDVPRVRLAGKALGEVEWLSVAAVSDGRIPAPEWPMTDSAEEALLWSSLEETLGHVASLRGTVPAKELLWLRVAQDLDELAWRETDLTADDLLSMPGYVLLRKMFADGMTEMTTTSILRQDDDEPTDGDDHCEIFHDTTMGFCAVLEETLPCRIPGLAPICIHMVRTCECTADCAECACLGGEPEGGNCQTDCCDYESDCVPPSS